MMGMLNNGEELNCKLNRFMVSPTLTTGNPTIKHKHKTKKNTDVLRRILIYLSVRYYMDIREKLSDILNKEYSKTIEESSDMELYYALLEMTKEMEKSSSRVQSSRKLYYFSAEFLIGKLLSNNLINLGIYDDVKTILMDAGKDITAIEGYEPEPSLGNGGLGRLAACFLDSIAVLF